MHIERIDIYVVKIGQQDRFGGQVGQQRTLGSSTYYFETEWQEVYSTLSQSCFLKLTTDDGLEGWGEAQAPIVPEAAGTLLTEMLGPMILGLDPRRQAVLYDRLYKSMNVRGHTTGFMIDAIAAIDIALWDLRGRHYGAPLCELLGGPFRTRLPAYVSGIRAPSIAERVQVARQNRAAGYRGVKAYLGRGLASDAAELQALQSGTSEGGPGSAFEIEADLYWKYDLATAQRLGKVADECQIAWLESPLPPEDILGHAALARSLVTPVAVGEPLRTAYEFQHWLRHEAIDILQPDVPRAGVTECKKIADLAAAYHRPVALHVGVCLGVGLAATWHLAASLPNFHIQEHQPVMLDLANRFLEPALEVVAGQLVVPMGPGLGVRVDEARLAPYVTHHWTVAE